jgi:hypothetical protein
MFTVPRKRSAVPEIATLLATTFPVVADHASALLTHIVCTDLIHVAQDNMAWIKRLIVEACMYAFN